MQVSSFRSRRQWKILRGLILLSIATTGCGPRLASNDPSSDDQVEVGSNGTEDPPLRVVVIDDPPLARAIVREWQAQSGQRLELVEKSSEAAIQHRLDADVVVFPSRLLGTLATSRQIVPFPRPWRPESETGDEADDHDYQWSDILPGLRRQELRWGSEVFGVSFGSPQLMLIYREDLLDQWGLAPPNTWSEYQEAAARIRDHLAGDPKGDPELTQPLVATLEPLGEGWAAATLLARAASSARHPNQYSTLFQFTTMKPLIDQPPFVEALRQLKDAVQPQPKDSWDLTPDQVIARLLAGEAVMALGWPSAAREVQAGPIAGPGQFAVRELPGAERVFLVSEQRWESVGIDHPSRVPLLGISGRIGAVARRARSPEASCNFLMWLTHAEHAIQVAPRSSATTLFRQSQTAQPQAWVEPALLPAAGQFAQQLMASQSHPNVVVMLRIPGHDRYLSALDDAVRQAVMGIQDPAQALRHVAQNWEEITRELGVESQRQAYLQSLGLQLD